MMIHLAIINPLLALQNRTFTFPILLWKKKNTLLTGNTVSIENNPPLPKCQQVNKNKTSSSRPENLPLVSSCFLSWWPKLAQASWLASAWLHWQAHSAPRAGVKHVFCGQPFFFSSSSFFSPGGVAGSHQTGGITDKRVRGDRLSHHRLRLCHRHHPCRRHCRSLCHGATLNDRPLRSAGQQGRMLHESHEDVPLFLHMRQP